jgi:hypothetical protein
MRLAVLSAVLLAVPVTSFAAANERKATRQRCDRLIDMLETMAPEQAYDALRTMRVQRDGNRYELCAEIAAAEQNRSSDRPNSRSTRSPRWTCSTTAVSRSGASSASCAAQAGKPS